MLIDNKATALNLRAKAEKILKKKPSIPISHFSIIDSQKLYHELAVHQIELELQNEELFQAKVQAIAFASKKYVELYDFAPTGYFTFSKQGLILDLNICGSEMLGKELARLKGSSFGFFVSEDTKTNFNLFLWNVFITNAKETCEVTLIVDGNLSINVQLKGIVIENGKSCFVTVNDITALKDITNDLQAINAEKDKFFSIIAHDLRSPLSGFLGLTEVIAEGFQHMELEEIHEITLLMKSSASNLFHLLQNLLEWSGMQRGLITFCPTTFLLLPKISDCIGLIQESAALKNIDICFDIPDNFTVFADINMLGVILRNLVSNAVKFTPKGGSISFSEIYVSNCLVQISMKDAGIGMNQFIIDNLFRIDTNTNRKGTEGEYSTGLGLIICKDFIEKNGGKLLIESEEGKGSIFHFTLPCSRIVDKSTVIKRTKIPTVTALQKKPAVSKLKILIAEDGEIFGRLIALGIKSFSTQVFNAKNGIEAVDICRNNPDIDLIIMDLKMPEMDGIEATRQIRQFNSDVVIIAQTGYEHSGDRKKALTSGFNDYISKPYGLSVLTSVLKKHFKTL